MFKFVLLSFIIVAVFISTPALSETCDIAGIWRHAAKPAKLSIDLNKGEISVYSHEINEKSTGLVVLKKLKQASGANTWQAKMHSAAEDSYVGVQIKTKNCDQLSVNYEGDEVLRLNRWFVYNKMLFLNYW